jgi:hypothetical protein
MLTRCGLRCLDICRFHAWLRFEWIKAWLEMQRWALPAHDSAQSMRSVSFSDFFFIFIFFYKIFFSFSDGACCTPP